MAVYVVTGGAGFIGSHIVEELLRRGENVKVVDNFSTGKRQNVQVFNSKAEIIEADIADAKNLAEFLQGADYVIHQAAIPSVPKSILDPLKSHHANVNGTLNLLLASRDAGVKRLVYASSSSLYGDSPTLPKHEGMMPNPLSPYGAQKLFGEMYCRVFTKAYGLETVSLRYFNVFGPRQDSTSQYSGVLALFIPAVLQGRRPTIYGDGLQSRDFTYVQNVVEANLLACQLPGVAGQVFNIACGDRITVNSMLHHITKIMVNDIAPVYAESRAGDIKHSQADITRAKEHLGYEPKISFEEGLRHTIEWYRAHL
ncbi:MAG: LPS biosynthesis protein WbpP [Acidobacteria bacterium]|nr:MAG: LPS biosynthesis protein WbpP [Acidobacteriota bacterium]